MQIHHVQPRHSNDYHKDWILKKEEIDQALTDFEQGIKTRGETEYLKADLLAWKELHPELAQEVNDQIEGINQSLATH